MAFMRKVLRGSTVVAGVVGLSLAATGCSGSGGGGGGGGSPCERRMAPVVGPSVTDEVAVPSSW
jgi:hypothetical protein